MDAKKLAATFAVLMIALGMAGFAYAFWSEFLYLNGTVTTGEVCVKWSFNAALPESNLKDLDGDGQADDPIAVLTYTMSDDDQDGYNETLTVTLTKAYPGLTVKGTIDVTNCGTIPVGIADYDWNIKGNSEIAEAVELVHVEFYLRDPNGGIHPITGDIRDWIAEVNQIDPGWSLVCEFEIRFTEDLPQEATATIEAYIEFRNWNEL